MQTADLDDLYTTGLALVERGARADARAVFELMAQIAPERAGPYVQLGFLLAGDGDVVGAGKRFAEALNRGETGAGAANGLAYCALQVGQHALAAQMARRALEAEPDFSAARLNLALALNGLGAFAEALEALLPLRTSAEGLLVQGQALQALGRSDEALGALRQAADLQPALKEARYLAIGCLQDLTRHEEALAEAEVLIAQDTADARAQFLRGLSRLTLGDLKQGFADYEARYRISDAYSPPQSFPEPVWTGREPLEGRSIVVHCEQGLGDTLQFCRFVPALARLGAEVHLVTRAPLKRILASLEGVRSISLFGEPRPPADFRIGFISLAAALGIDEAGLYPAAPYLKADEDGVRAARRRLGAPSAKRIGLVWSGGVRDGRADSLAINTRRNIPLSVLAPLFSLDIEWIGLQQGEALVAEHTNFIASHPERSFVNYGPDFADFADTAALITQLDGLVSVDTSVVHLAGALGVPVLLLNRFDACWRWMRHRSDSPWYPDLILLRQDRPSDWDAVVAKAFETLGGWP